MQQVAADDIASSTEEKISGGGYDDAKKCQKKTNSDVKICEQPKVSPRILCHIEVVRL